MADIINVMVTLSTSGSSSHTYPSTQSTVPRPWNFAGEKNFNLLIWLSYPTNWSYPTLRGPPTFMVIHVAIKFSVNVVTNLFIFLNFLCLCFLILFLLSEKMKIIYLMRVLHFPLHINNLSSIFTPSISLPRKCTLFSWSHFSICTWNPILSCLFWNLIPFVPFLCCIFSLSYY